MLFYAIRQIFLKGGTIKDAIYHVFKTTGKMPTKSEGKKIINVYQDVQKNTGKVIEFPKDRITPFYKPRPGEGVANTKQRIFQIDEELEKLSAGEGKYAKMNRNDREDLMIKLQDESSTLQDKTLFKDSPEAIAKIKADNKAAVESLKKKKIKSKESVGLFANEQEFASELDSIRRNLIKNDPDFNLEIAESFLKPGNKTYGWTPTGDKSKLLSPKQRQKVLDNIKDVMKHDEYQHQFGEDFDFTKITDDMFRTEKASGGIARVGMFVGGPIVKGGNWFLKALRDTRKLMTQNKQHSPEQLKYYLNQIDDQIKNIEAGGKIPDEVIQTIRKDPKFKSVSQKSANDPDLREIEEVLLEYGEKHASGGIAGQLHLNEGGRASFTKGGKVSSGLANILGV